jgi:hypothetical protein
MYKAVQKKKQKPRDRDDRFGAFAFVLKLEFLE